MTPNSIDSNDNDSKLVTTTHKIEVRIAGSSEEKNENWKRLREMDSLVYKAFNDGVTACHLSFLINNTM